MTPASFSSNEYLLGERIALTSNGGSNNSEYYLPTLGSIWHYCVNTRLVLTAIPSTTVNSYSSSANNKKCIVIHKSAMVGKVSLPYKITEKGLEFDDNSQEND